MTARGVGGSGGDPRFPYGDFTQQRHQPNFGDHVVPQTPNVTEPQPVPPAQTLPLGEAGGTFPGVPQEVAADSSFPAAGGRRVWLIFILGLAAFLGVIGIWAALNQLGGEHTSSLPPVSQAEPEHNTGGSPLDRQMVTGSWIMRISDVDMDASSWLGSKYFLSGPGAGEKPVAVKLAFTNTSREARDPYFEFQYTLTENSINGAEYFDDLMIISSDLVINVGDVEPGDTGVGWIVFTVPKQFNGGVLTVTNWDDFTYKTDDFPIP